MKRQDFFYDLPKELIAQEPLQKRDNCRLLVYNRSDKTLSHKHFFDLPDYLGAGDVVVLNNTKVIPARLYGTKTATGAKIEVLLLRRITLDTWEVLLRPQKRVSEGTELVFGGGILKATVAKIKEEGAAECRFEYEGVFESILEKIGEMPLPHYITKKIENNSDYQTVYGKIDGSVAAPTAGLHFTKELIEKLKAKGVIFCEVLLHVGLGTFRPVKAENLTDHKMHSEYFEISDETRKSIKNAKKAGRRVVCCGTTSVRVLESVWGTDKKSGFTDIFIYPPYKFKAVDAMITNFHLPESTLIMLVSAFAGTEETKNIYREAVAQKYRFFSFGDAMIIL